MFKGEADFVQGLKAISATLCDALFDNPEFQKLWQYLKNCPGVTIALALRLGLKDDLGVERFGQYSPKEKLIELNVLKPEHLHNPAEVLDTLIHELIHALWDVRAICGAENWPLPAGAYEWDHDVTRPQIGPEPNKDSPNGPNKQHAEAHYGDSPSDPKDYVDLNDQAQLFIIRLVTAAIAVTTGGEPDFELKGAPTLTFKNWKKLHGTRRVTKNWQAIRAITWEDRCWRRTSTARGWVMECRCDCCEMVVKYLDGTTQIDLIDTGDKVEFDGASIHFKRLAGWERR
jgi:hypothetical protein